MSQVDHSAQQSLAAQGLKAPRFSLQRAFWRLGARLAQAPRKLLWLLSLQKSRRALSRLDDRLREDIGLSRDQLAAEQQRKIWDAPRHWRL